MPAISSGRNNAARFQEVLASLKQITQQVETTAAAFSALNVADIEVKYETSLADGLDFLHQWADAARDAVRNARLRELGTVSGNSGTCPPDSENGANRKENSLQQAPNLKVTDTGEKGGKSKSKRT